MAPLLSEKLRRLSLRQRFLVAPLLGLLLLGMLLVVFIHELQRQNALLTDVTEQRLAEFGRHSEVFIGLAERHLILYDLLMRGGQLDEKTVYIQAKSHLDAIKEAVTSIKEGSRNATGNRGNGSAFEAQYDYLLRLTENYRRGVTYAVEMGMLDPRLAPTHVALANERFGAMNRGFSHLMDLQRQELAIEIAAEIRQSRKIVGIYSVAGLAGAGLLLFLSMMLSRFLSRALEVQIDTLSQLDDAAETGLASGSEVERIAHAVESFRQTQMQLRDSEQRFRSFFEDNHAVMLLIDPESGAILAANASAAEFYGYAREHLSTMTIQEINVLPPEQVAANRQRALHERQRYFVFSHRLANGQQRDVEVLATPIATGSRTLIFSIIHDITERKRAEVALQKNQQLLQSVLDHSGAVVFVKDMEGRYLLVNRHFEQRFHVSRDSMIGKTDYDFLPAATADALRLADCQTLAAGRVTEFEEDLPQNDGLLHTYISIKCPLYDGNGQAYAVCGIATDITERKQIEIALRTSQAALYEAQAVAKVGSWTHDLRIDALSWSDETYRIFGMPPGGPLSLSSFIQRVHPSDREFVLASWEAALIGQPYDIEHRIEVNGEVRWVRECAHIRFDAEGMACYGIGTVQDITELRLAQDALGELNRELERRVTERTSQLEAASRAKSDFLANLSHEIRTPMNTVLGMAHLMQTTELTPRQRDYIEKIHASGRHLLGLIDAILDFSKIEAGKLDLDISNFEFATLMQRLGDLCIPQAEAKGLRLTFDLDPRIPRSLRGDSLRLEQILINFTNNAVKFTERGEITVRAGLVEDLADAGCLLRFDVRDTGIGMRDAEKDKLFQAFQQADSSTTRKYGGTGLGLAISKQLAVLMGGTVGMESRLGEGSCFWFTVRLGKCATAVHAETMDGQSCGCVAGQSGADTCCHADSVGAERHSVPAQVALKGARILVVDDHPLNQQVACDLLEVVGATVCVANSGQEAIDLLLVQCFDCVLLDVQMPGMDGIEVIRRIRATPKLKAMSVIAITANAWNQDRERCLAAGMDDFISKPIQPDILYSTLAKWLPSRALAAAAPAPAVAIDRFAGDPDIIDLAVPAKTLQNDPAKLGRVARKFLEATWIDIAKIEEALERGDTEMLGTLGHRIKSPARAMGASGLADLCLELEQLREGCDVKQAVAAVRRLRPLLEQISQQIACSPLLANRD